MNEQTEVSIKFANKITNEKKLVQYAETLKKVNTFLTSIDTGKAKAVEDVAKSTNKISNKSTTDGVKTLGNNLATAFNVTKLIAFRSAFERTIKEISTYTKKSADFLENWNLLDVAFQNNTTEAEKFVNTLTEMYGLDESWAYRTVGIFKQLSNAMGLTDEVGTKLSKTLTQLAIDTSSLYNIDIEDTVSILQSGLAGQTKPVRRLGGDITQTTLQLTLDAYGIDETINQLTYAEKRLVIVTALLNQTEEASGDWGRTIESVANQMRIFQQQVERLTRAIGNVFLPILKTILPYMNAIIMVLTEIISWFALLIGYDPEEFDFFSATNDSVIDLKENLDGAGASAKKLQSGLRSFDKLNVIKTPSATGGGVGGGLNGVDPKILEMFNKASDDYLNNLDKVQMKATGIRDSIMEWLGFTELTDEKGNHLGFTFEKITGGTILGALAVGGLIFVGVSKIFGIFKKITGLFGKKPTSGSMGDVMTNKTNWQSLSDGLGKMFDKLGTAAIIIGVLGGIALVLKEITGLFKTLSESGYEATDVLTIMGTVVGSVTILIAALTVAAKLLASPMAMGGLVLVVAGISAILLVMEQTLPTILEHLGNFIVKIAPALNEILDVLLQGIEDIIYALGTILPPIINSVGTLFEKIFTGVDKLIQSVGKVIVDIMTTADKTISNVLKTILDFIKELGPAINTFVDNAIKAVTKLINFLISGIEYTINTLVIGAINSFLMTLNKIPGVDFDPLRQVNIKRFVPRLKVGMDFVPSDNFPAYLDYGERVLTRQENEDYNRGIIRGENAVSGTPINATFVIQVGDKEIAEVVLNDLQEMARSNGQPIQIGA